jgi:hypothetical protein
MKEPAGHSIKALKEICNRIVVKHPDAIGMATIELDCGCINVCGVSFKGEPVGSIMSIPAHQEAENDNSVVCFKCLEKKSEVSDRIINRGIIWPGDENEIPAEEIRLYIGREVFGPGFSE